MTNDGTFTGELQHDSPALLGVLKRYFSEEEQRIIKSSYAVMHRCHLLEHRNLPREEGVSYNPLPARIAILLINEGDIRNVDIICAGILYDLTPDQMRTYQVSSNINAIIQSVKGGDTPDLDARSILIAHDLDLLRHAHLLTQGSDTTDAIRAVMSRSNSFTAHKTRLEILRRAALDRVSRTLL